MFYDKFVALSQNKGVSPSAAAIDAGISKSLVTKWKNNPNTMPSMDVLIKLSKYFNVSVDELAGNIIEKKTALSETDLTEDELRILSAFREMSPERQKALADLLGIGK